VSIAAQLQWEKLIRAGFYRFLERGMFNEEQIASINQAPEKGLLSFIKMALGYKSWQTDTPIRRPDGLAWDFYQLNGGAGKLAPFLFGTASQHRN
jgi:hypothetical protein